MTFRSPVEAVALANNTVYGLAGSVWSQDISLALDMAFQIKAGVIWVNCHNMFDAAAGFGGYKESGFGRESGKEGLLEYVDYKWKTPVRNTFTKDEIEAPWGVTVPPPPDSPLSGPAVTSLIRQTVDRTFKMYIGGRQVRPDAPYARSVWSPSKVDTHSPTHTHTHTHTLSLSRSPLINLVICVGTSM
jgi:aldehyde dehydrogenase (NAD+)